MYRFSEDYTFRSTIQAARQNVFRFLESVECIQEWWENPVKGHADEGGNITFELKDSTNYFFMNVDSVHAPSRIQWSVIKDTGYEGEWEETRIVFELIRIDAESCYLDFFHVGLTPDLVCYEESKIRWEHFLTNLIQISERDFNHNSIPVSEKFLDKAFI